MAHPRTSPLGPFDEDRARGALLGLAVGDALGTTLEFRAPGTFEPIEDMIGGGPFGLEPGQWTDDTSMALCLAESLVESGAFDPRDQMARYVRWWREGHGSSTGRCFDIGTATRTALARFERTGEAYAGSTDPNTAGNGSLMRLAPVAIAYAHEPAEAVRLAGESSRTTHGAREAVDACRYFASLLIGAMRGVPKDDLLAPRYAVVPSLWDEAPPTPTIDEVAAGSFREKEPPEIRGTGHVVRTLEAALWAFARTDDFRSGALTVVNLGDDADTTGAVFGQIAGAASGERAIPDGWRDRITQGAAIRDLADAAARIARS
jgi:ADP-ribosylglycohydrolase